ncbi:MAG: hypothetical protein ABIJ00_12510 [Candidatus Eisenbacteria bacterium]
MIEQEHHRKAFEFYYGLGEGRSYKLVAQEFGVSLATVKVWGKSFGWRDRVRERDADAARAMADDNLKSSSEKTARNRKIVEMGLIQVAKAIAEGKVKPTISDLDRLVRLEEFLRRGATAPEGEGSLLEQIKRRYAARQKGQGYT